MAIMYSAPHTLSCARLVSMHSLIPFYKDSITFQQPIKDSILSISYSHSSERIKPARSLKTGCIRPDELATVTGDTWEECVIKSEIPVLVEFWAAWCGPCRMVHREIEEIAVEYSGKIKCFTIKADEEIKVAEKYDVKVVPVVVLFRNGKQCESVTGTMPTYVYTNAIDKLLST